MKFYIFLTIIFTFFFSCSKKSRFADEIMSISEIDNLGININTNLSRPFVFTNRESAFFYAESGNLRQNGHQGFVVNTIRYLDDYILKSNGSILDRKNAREIIIFPDRIKRTYANGVVESTYLLDHENCLVIELTANAVQSFEFHPLFASSLDFSAMEKTWSRRDDLLMLLPTTSDEAENTPEAIAIKFDCETEYFSDKKDRSFCPIPSIQAGSFKFHSNKCRIFIVIGEHGKDVKRKSRNLQKYFVQYINKKKQRISKLLAQNKLETNIELFNKAFQWALISMDQLIMRQTGAGKRVTGIFAGLPWFNNYWGRDTFISLPGAVLVTGRMEEAKKILLSFAQFQNTNSDDPNYGRIPNQVTTENIIYNTADGTPWFIKQLWEYYQYSGDEELLKSLYDVVKRSVNGTIKHHSDENGLLTHDDADTWMDAKGTKGPWSPRGDRAVDIQALWYHQLNAGVQIAIMIGDSVSAKKWSEIASDLKQNFLPKFWNRKRRSLYDHLNADGSPDLKIRPNQIFAITIPESPLMDPQHEVAVLREVVTKLTYPYGVASLWQHDQDFHPYHVMPAYYPKDEAYHNGTVWGWLAGPVITGLMKYGYKNLAFELLFSESYQVLKWGAAGTLSELLNAIPPKGWEVPEISGTVSQAWSLAEYIRNIYQDLLGIHPNVPEKTIHFSPHIPDAFEFINFKIPVPENDIQVKIEQTLSENIYQFDYVRGNHPWKIDFEYPISGTEKISFQFELDVKDSVNIHIPLSHPQDITLNSRQIETQHKKIAIGDSLLGYLSFAVPQLDKNLNYLKPPPYPLLTGPQIKAWNPKAQAIIQKSFPKFDDKGPDNKYTYPQNSHFKDGIFDLNQFQFLQDSENYYFRLQFRELVQPGWHPEYGFQLTFIAIALNQGIKKEGEINVPRNAKTQLPEDYSFHRIIFIGGGLQLEDSEGKIVLAHRPQDVLYALGDIQKKEISFAIPKKYLGKNPHRWKLSILIGGQDDHGGGGIGEFREIAKEASDWHGGGKSIPGESNIYDVVFIDKILQ